MAPSTLQEDILNSLQPATKERPALLLPEDFASSKSGKPPPVVQGEYLTKCASIPINSNHGLGLVYLLDPANRRPSPSDFLVLTARSYQDPDTVVAGARIPVSKVKFPFRFIMSEKNIVKGQEGKVNTDLLVKAAVCPEDSPKFPCSDAQASMKGEGIAKLLRDFGGLPEGVEVRAGASVGLE